VSNKDIKKIIPTNRVAKKTKAFKAFLRKKIRRLIVM